MKLFLLIANLLCISFLFGQQTATTKDGKTVTLNDNGTWQYVVDVDGVPMDTTSVKTGEKSTAATKLLKSERNQFAIWYNDKKWKLTTNELNKLAEFKFINSGKFEEAFGMIINERVEGTLDLLKNQIIENAKGGVTDFQLHKQEIRTINNIKVLHLVFSGKASGLNIKYFGYYSTHESGITQLILFTTKSLYKVYEKDFEEFANGLVLIQE